MSKEKNQITNSKAKDSGGKLIFENDTLCSQFLRNYSGIEILKDVRPEDIEDVSERYIPMFTEERNSDVVKRIRLGNKELFVVALIEHKSRVDYNVIMQLMRYMVYIWENYEKDLEKDHPRISARPSFKYPPIIPIVYYEGNDTWTAATRLSERIYLSDVFSDYIPDYSYLLFRLYDHEQSELIDKNDEISLVMLINKLKSVKEFKNLKFPEGYFDNISQRAPQEVLNILSRVIAVLLREINVPEDTLLDFTDQIKERRMGRLFEDFEPFDYQEWKRTAREDGLREGREEGREEGIRVFIIDKLEDGVSEAVIKQKLIKLFDLDETKAEEFIKKYSSVRIS